MNTPLCPSISKNDLSSFRTFLRPIVVLDVFINKTLQMTSRDLLTVLQAIQALREQFEVAEGNKRRARALVERCEINGKLLEEIQRDVDRVVWQQSEAFSSALRRMSEVVGGCDAFVTKYSMRGWQRRIVIFVNAKSIAAEFDELCRQLDQARGDLQLSIGVRPLIRLHDNNNNINNNNNNNDSKSLTNPVDFRQDDEENLNVMVEMLEANGVMDARNVLMLKSCEEVDVRGAGAAAISASSSGILDASADCQENPAIAAMNKLEVFLKKNYEEIYLQMMTEVVGGVKQAAERVLTKMEEGHVEAEKRHTGIREEQKLGQQEAREQTTIAATQPPVPKFPEYPTSIIAPLDNDTVDNIQKVFVARLHSLKEADERAHIDTPRDGSVRGVLSGCWRLREAALRQLFAVDTLSESRSNSNNGVRVRRSYPEGRGVRDVAVVKAADPEPSDDDNTYGNYKPDRGLSFHFKSNPEFPFHELAINQLGLMLFGDAVLHDVLEVRMCGRWFVFLVSETVVGGKTLAEELQWFDKDFHEVERQRLSKALLARMCRKSFARSCLMAMLCRLQDQKPDNVLIREDGTLACIDNERAFVVDRCGYWSGKSEVQSVLFCMDAMEDSIEDEIVELIGSWGEDCGFDIVGRWLRRLERLFSDMQRRSSFPSNLSSFVLAPAIVWKLIVGITQLWMFAEVSTYRRMLEILLPETSVAISRVLSEFGSIQRRFRSVSEYSGSSLSSKLTTMDVMLKLLNEKVGEVKGLEWYGQPFQPQSPIVLLNLIPHIRDRLMGPILGMIGILNQEKAVMDERWWRRLLELGKSLHDMDLLDHVLDKVDFSQGVLSEKVNQIRFLKLLENLSHSHVVLVNAMHLSERQLSFLRNSPNLTSLSLKGCQGISSFPASLAQTWQKVRTLRLQDMSLGNVVDVSKMMSLAKLELITVTGLRKLVLSSACVRLDLTNSWTTEMDVIELGQTVGLKRENVIGVGCVGSLSLEHARDEIIRGNVEPLQYMPTTHEIEEVLEMLDWSQIAENIDSGSSMSRKHYVVEFISRHSFHRLFLIKALWITRDQLREMLRRSTFLKILCLRGSNINKEALLALTPSSFPQLESLDVSDCLELQVTPGDIERFAGKLRNLHMANTSIEYCKTRTGIFFTRHCLQSVSHLDLSNCKSLKSISIQLPNLKSLNLSYCNPIEEIDCHFDRQKVDIQLLGTNIFQQLKGHTNYVYCVSELSDGRLASGSGDHTVRVWDVSSGKFVTLKGHTDSVMCVVELRDGRLASGSDDGTIKVWNVINGECVITLKDHSGCVYSVVELRDGRLASGSGDHTVIVWDVSSGKCVMKLEDHTDSVMCVVELRDGRLASGSDDGTIKVWDVSSGECVTTLEGCISCVSSVVELRDGRLASGFDDDSVGVWDVRNGERVMTMEGHTDLVSSVVELRDGRLASGSHDGTLKVWDMLNRECVMTLIGHTERVTIVVELRDGRLASGSDDGTIKVWDVSSGECVTTLKGHTITIWVRNVVELRDNRLTSGSSDNALKVWTYR